MPSVGVVTRVSDGGGNLAFGFDVKFETEQMSQSNNYEGQLRDAASTTGAEVPA